MKKKYKTTFPVARIKKIMQMDEDVGKVAQATPVLISKALELFLQSLIDTACEETRARSGKRLSVAHLKKTILTTDQFDFLKDVVENVPDPSEATGTNIAEDGKTAVVGDSNSSNSSGSNSGVQPRRRERKGGEGSSTGAGVGRGRGKRSMKSHPTSRPSL